jgi:energy-coupling factor transport system substrate-specific component
MTGRRAPSLLVGLVSIVGVLTILYPFLLPLFGQEQRLARRGIEVPILFAVLGAICLLTILAEIQSTTTGPGASASKLVALLGVLVATDAALRLIPSVLGASPIFLLIILTGFAYGADFGFLMGALTLLVSAFITGGVGPWLPFQMLTAGWIGLTAGLLPRTGARREVAMLALFGGIWGLLFGAIMNLWEWPFTAPGLQVQVGLYWVPGMTLWQTLHTYAHFYLVTSLVYDLFRTAANVVLVVLLARPVLRLLDRFRERFSWQPWVPYEPATLSTAPALSSDD